MGEQRADKPGNSLNQRESSHTPEENCNITYLCDKLNLRVFYQNVRGFNTKVQFDVFRDFGLNIFALFEAWLCPQVDPYELFQQNFFNVFRHDRDGRRGGGILVAVTSNFSVNVIPVHFPISIIALFNIV